jgi:hypothetical protein
LGVGDFFETFSGGFFLEKLRKMVCEEVEGDFQGVRH